MTNSLLSFRHILFIMILLLTSSSILNAEGKADQAEVIELVGGEEEWAKLSPENQNLVVKGVHLLSDFKKQTSDKQFQKALETAKEWTELCRGVFGESNWEYARALRNVGAVNIELSRFDDAAKIYDKCLEIETSVFEGHSFAYGTLLAEAATVYSQLKLYPKAISAFQKSSDEFVKSGHRNSVHNYNILKWLGEAYVANGDREDAVLVFKKSLSILPKVVPADGEYYSNANLELAELLYGMGEFASAKPYYLFVLDYLTKSESLGTNQHFVVMDKLGDIYTSLSDNKSAVLHRKGAYDLVSAKLPKSNPNYLFVVTKLAESYTKNDEYELAEAFIQESIDGWKNRKNYKTQYTRALLAKSELHYRQGDYFLAKEYARQSVHQCDDSNGIVSLYQKINCYNFMAMVCQETGDLDNALKYFKICEGLYTQHGHEQSKEFPTTLGNLGNLYGDLGDLKEAETYLLRAKDLLEELNLQSGVSYRRTLHNLASVYKQSGRLGLAKELASKSVGDSNTPTAVHTHLLLASLHMASEDLESAEVEYTRCIEHYSQPGVAIDSKFAVSHVNIATLYTRMGLNNKAIQHYQKGIDLFVQLFGTESLRLCDPLSSCALTLSDVGSHEKALEMQTWAMKNAEIELDELCYSLSPREQRIAERKSRELLGEYVITCVRAGREKEVPQAVNAWRLRASRRAELLRTAMSGVGNQNALEEIQSISKELSQLTYASRTNTNIEVSDRVSNLRKKKEILELKLIQQLDHADLESRKVDFRFHELLSKQDVLIDFIDCADFQTRRMVAIIYTSDQDPAVVDICGTNEIESLTQEWLLSLESDSEWFVAGEALSDKLWVPISERISGKTRVYISPDGPIHRISLAGLWDQTKDCFLASNFEFSYVSMNSIVSKQTGNGKAKDAAKKALLVGGVDYNAGSGNTQTSQTSPDAEPLVQSLFGRKLQYLPGTLSEVNSVASELINSGLYVSQDVTILRGEHASKDAFFEGISTASTAHVATHGFYESAPTQVTTNKLPDHVENGIRYESWSINYNPIDVRNSNLKVGIAFAGANQQTEHNNSFLTALEIHTHDFSHVELLTLSTCHSGAGDIINGEGVFSLQRSFADAGVQNTIASIWEVSDYTADRWMRQFYRNYARNEMNASGAIRATQLWATESPEQLFPPGTDISLYSINGKLSPRFWAGYQLLGKVE